MKQCLLSILLCLFSWASFCQQSDTVAIVKSMGNLYFVKNGSTHNVNELKNLVATNTEAVKYATKSSTLNAMTTFFCCAGGFMIGWPLGTYMGGGDPEWGLCAVGAGLVTVGFVTDRFARKNAHRAVEIYNNGLKIPESTSFNPELGIGLTGNGVGLTLRF